jgi:hypothetical protein
VFGDGVAAPDALIVVATPELYVCANVATGTDNNKEASTVIAPNNLPRHALCVTLESFFLILFVLVNNS